MKGDERIRTAVPVGTTDPLYGSRPHRSSADYIDRVIETVRVHRDADSSWPQWANILADEIEDLRADRGGPGMSLDADLATLGYSEETCVRCGWRMGQPPLNCQNDNTPHRFLSQEAEIARLGERLPHLLRWVELITQPRVGEGTYAANDDPFEISGRELYNLMHAAEPLRALLAEDGAA